MTVLYSRSQEEQRASISDRIQKKPSDLAFEICIRLLPRLMKDCHAQKPLTTASGKVGRFLKADSVEDWNVMV